MNKQRIVLGSGKLYIDEFDGSTVPSRSTMEVDNKLLGLIKNGAELVYASETYTAEDDLGLAKKTILTKETVTLKSGIMTWNMKTLEKLCATARVTDSTTERIAKIGGVGNQDGKSYVVFFVHEDKADGDITAAIVGKNTAGLTIAFKKDAETVIDAEFTAEPQDGDGTLVLLTEEVKEEE